MTRPLPKTLRNLVAKAPERFDEGHTEQDDWAGLGTWSHWLYLRPGWCFPEPGSHIIHEHTIAEVKQAWKLVARCDCDDCTTLLKGEEVT
jgi:hypothetical protein